MTSTVRFSPTFFVPRNQDSEPWVWPGGITNDVPAVSQARFLLLVRRYTRCPHGEGAGVSRLTTMARLFASAALPPFTSGGNMCILWMNGTLPVKVSCTESELWLTSICCLPSCPPQQKVTSSCTE